jgi:hypothetical protein
MLTTGSKMYLTASAALLVLAWVYGWSSGADYPLGPITLGYKGGVGEHTGFVILVGLAGCALFLGLFLTALRDTDRAVPDGADLSDDPRAEQPAIEPSTLEHPADPSPWPFLAAAATGVIVVGLVYSSFIVALGIGTLTVSIVGWAQHVVSMPVPSRPASSLPAIVDGPPAPSLPVGLLVAGRVIAVSALFGGILFTLYAMSQNIRTVFVGPLVIGLALVARAVTEWYEGGEIPGDAG